MPSKRDTQRVRREERPLLAFISSVMDDEMKPARDMVIETLEARAPYLQPWAFEVMPASPEPVVASYISKISEARLVIWLVGSTVTHPVEAEIEEAIRTRTDVLAFLLPVEQRDERTEAFLQRVRSHFRYRSVPSFDSLPLELDRALAGVVIRALRDGKETSVGENLDLVGRASRARCVERWLATGIDAKSALDLAGSTDVGAAPAETLPSDLQPLVILAGEPGLGKSLASERFLQAAVAERLKTADAPAPVFVRAREVGGSLREEVTKAAEPIGDPTRTGVALVIDGADEAGVAAADRLLSEARELARSWLGSRILLTTRPFTPVANAEEVQPLPRLSEERSRQVVGIGAGREITLADRHRWSEPVREAAKVPLFALLLGLSLKTGQRGASRAQLLSALASRTASSVEAESRPLLRRLATLSVERGNGPVPESELGGPERVAQLERTRLISRTDGWLRFPLVLIAQWFAAEALAEEDLAVSDLIAAPEDLELWRYPLALLAANFDHDQVAAVIGPLARAHPGFASQVIEEAIAKWSSGEGQTPPPLQESGRRLRDAHTAWLEGLGEISKRLFPGAVADDGTIALPPLGLAIEDSRITAGWYAGDAPQPEVFHLPEEALDPLAQWSPEVAGNWLRMRMSRPSAQAAWAWRWSFEELRYQLQYVLQERELLIDPEIKARRLWRAALMVMRLPSSHQAPILLAELRERAREIGAEGPTTYANTRGEVQIDGLLVELVELAADGRSELRPPPRPRARPRGRVLLPRHILNELALEDLADLYLRALEAYRTLTTGLFAPLQPFMRMAALLPVCLHAEVYPVDPEASPTNAGLRWWLEPLPFGEQSRTNFVLGEDRPQDEFATRWSSQANALKERTRQLRPQQARWLSPTLHSQILRPPTDSEVEDIVLGWLWDDLRQIGWVEGQLGERSRWNRFP